MINMKEMLDIMAIDSYEGRNVVTFDVNGSYRQIDPPKYKFTLLLLEGNFVDIMCEINH